MAYPTISEIDAAVPVTGTPDRGRTNAVLRALAAALPEPAVFPEENTVPVRTSANGPYTAGRLKAAAAMDPEDCVIYAQAVRRVPAAPTAADSPGEMGDFFAAADFIYHCTAPNTWVRSATTPW